MNKYLSAALAAVVLISFTPHVVAAEVKAELEELVGKIKAKLKAGNASEQDLADELKAFDALLAAHKGEKTDDVAQVLFMKATLYAQVLDNQEKSAELFKQIQTDFPDTTVAKKAGDMMASLAKQAEARKIQQGLAKGTQFPDFAEKDLDGKPLSIANFKGKVVLIDFWATWCGPCVEELPNVLKAYETYHDKGFEIIGISLDSDKEKLTTFLKEKKMAWPQYFDGKGWQNSLAAKYGVNSIPATYLLDKNGKIVGKSLRGEALVKAVADALQSSS